MMTPLRDLLLSASLFALAGVVLASWAEGFRIGTTEPRRPEYRLRNIAVSKGWLVVGVRSGRGGGPSFDGTLRQSIKWRAEFAPETRHELFGLHWGTVHELRGSGDSVDRVFVEDVGAVDYVSVHPLIVIAVAIGLGMWLAASLRTRRRRGLVCRACGYDLRATPNRCPECGVVRMSSPDNLLQHGVQD